MTFHICSSGPFRSLGGQSSWSCVCFGFNKNRIKCPLRWRLNKEKGRGLLTIKLHCYLLLYPLLILQWGYVVLTCYLRAQFQYRPLFKALKFYASVSDECYHTLNKPKHISTSSPHKFFISLQSQPQRMNSAIQSYSSEAAMYFFPNRCC